MIEEHGLNFKEICLVFKELISRQDVAALSWIDVFEGLEELTWVQFATSNFYHDLEKKAYFGETLPESVVKLIEEGEKIKAIVKIRELTGFGLRKAKQMYDLYVEHKRIPLSSRIYP